MVKHIIAVLSLFFSSISIAVEGYKDIYIDREQDIVIHGILCGPDINNLKTFKPSYVFTNTTTISKGTYYYDSPHGNYSLTFNPTQNSSVMGRGLLKQGQTKKEQMLKHICIVSKLAGLPSAINNQLNQITLSAEDPNWDETMAKYTFVSGKPAYGAGVYQNQRTTAKFDQADKAVFEANQAYLKEMEKIFSHESSLIAKKLPLKLQQAIEYAHENDGRFEGKTYPAIKEPAVWTPTSKERYNDLNRLRRQTMDWDKVTQLNFDWFFGLVGKDNKLMSTQLLPSSKVRWNVHTLEQLTTVKASFENGKSLELDFLITSSKVNPEVFDNMETIKKKALLVRNNPIVSSREPRKPVSLPNSDSIDVYSPTDKISIFFSPFRDKALGDTYRYK
ncbi:hypothetical protein [Paraferrimonas sp. SM1919]|uniref:hypothetical protein n=1 Tax=Paraferrimonas sp. SM1919 TaxID=2662263 RepID=UPI0013D1E60B|nr:hypothetical protein [Paraferrimonas sp. SM1919]